ncbi:hypothetical protein Taro_017811 [Colocasia esculenta]|uniref:Uncharacterized protein n=1 Tax=Colocasia esculenta TaxID=4460 RepID=A0A843UP45_COLES|nr:hypothetical protein [Colocasia esculenta]
MWTLTSLTCMRCRAQNSGGKQSHPLGRSPQRLSSHPITSPGFPKPLSYKLNPGYTRKPLLTLCKEERKPELGAMQRLNIGGFNPARGNQGEGFPTTGLAPASTKNPEEWCFGGFLGLPKESFTAILDPFGIFTRGKYPTHNVPPWLREVGVAERRPVRTSRDVTSGRSSRPRHRKVLYFPHRHLWIMEYSCKVWCKPCRRRLIPRQHSRLSWRLRQEGEMEQYLEEKKASQKRPAVTFQRQDKKKAVYQTPQRSMAVGSS